MPELAVHGGPEAAAGLAVPDWPRFTPTAREYVLDALESGHWSRNTGGEWCDRLEREFADYHDAEHAVAVANGTVALELALLACGVQPGDEVVVPSYSFVASASAVPAVGAVPRFVDADPRTYNPDVDHLREVVTDRTVGMIGVHFAGYPMNMDELLPFARERDLFVIEDAAHAQGTEWRGRKVGAMGDVGAFSFQQTKSLPSGEGGILVTDDDVIADRARLLHNIGREQGSTGYFHTRLASNARLSEYGAALATAALEDLPEQNARRMDNERVLVEELEAVDGIHTKPRDDRITNRGYCLFNFRVDVEELDLPRDRFLEALRAEGVPASDGYGRPIYRQPAFYREEVAARVPPDARERLPNYRTLHLPGAERLCRENVAMSHVVLLAEEAGIRSIADAVRKVVDGADALRE